MAHPFDFQENYEDGTKGNFDGTTVDGGSALTFLHWKRLRASSLAPMPFRGAYLPQINLASVDSSGTYFLEDTAFDHSSNVTRHLRFMFFVTSDLVMAASDIFDIFQIRSASLVEFALSVRNNSGAIEIGAGETAGSTRTKTLSLGEWHTVEATLAIQGAGGSSGTIDFFIDGAQVGTQVTGITHVATTNARLGVQNIDAGTTTGRIYYDQVVYDDTRVFPHATRKPSDIIVTDSEHVFVGPGVVSSATLLTTGASNLMHVYDTDTANVNDDQSRKIELDLNTHTSVEGPFYFNKGCYVELGGTDPRGQITIETQTSLRTMIYFDSGQMRNAA